jgi:hydrogenase nickel incorporation protein HypB
MILSVTEGDDKPGKYPLMFHESKVLLITRWIFYPMWIAVWIKISEDALKINPNIISSLFHAKQVKGWINGLNG